MDMKKGHVPDILKLTGNKFISNKSLRLNP